MAISTTLVDSIDQLNPDALTFDNFRWEVGTGRDYSTGKGYNKVHKYRNGVQTAVGDVEVSVWYEAALQIIIRAGEADLLDSLESWVIERPLPFTPSKTSPTPRHEAIHLHMSRIFENEGWVDYIPFCRKFYPQEVAGKSFIWVLTSCCPKAGEVTQKQIRSWDGNDTAACPHCGRHTTIYRMKGDFELMEKCFEIIAAQQGTDTKNKLYWLGEQLREILTDTPAAQTGVAIALEMPGQKLADMEKKIAAFARSNGGCCPPNEADRIIREFYKVGTSTAPAPAAPQSGSLGNLTDFL